MSVANSPVASRAGSPAEPTQHSDNEHHESPANVADDSAMGDATGDTTAADADAGDATGDATAGDAASDKESDLLSEIDEDQFEDYDPALEERPVEIDEDIAKTLKASKRKRPDGEAPRKPKEGRRPKKRARPVDDDGAGAEDGDHRPRKARATDGGVGKDSDDDQVNEEDLSPEERRRRAIQRAMDDALKNPSKRRRKKDDIVRGHVQTSRGSRTD